MPAIAAFTLSISDCSSMNFRRPTPLMRWIATGSGATHALAVERALGRPVTRCAFLFLCGSTTTRLYVPDLWEATEGIEELASALAGPEPSWNVSPGPP
jgi:hypothetical protein